MQLQSNIVHLINYDHFTQRNMEEKKKLVDHHSFKFLAEQFREIHLHAAKNPKNVFAEGLLSQLKTILHIGRSVYKPEAFKRAPHTSFTEHELSVLFFNSLPRERFFFFRFIFSIYKTHADVFGRCAVKDTCTQPK